MTLLLVLLTLIEVIWTAIVVFVNSQWKNRLGTDGMIMAWVVLAVAWLCWWFG